MTKKLLLIGWDAADWKVIDALMAEGKMPALQRMIQQGTSGNLRTLQPPLSPMLWTSIATGKRPFKHGIYGFTEPTPKGDAVQPITNISRTSKAIWNILNQNDHRSVVVGWWPSHPAEPIRGTMVSDMFHKAPAKPGAPWPLKANCVHPQELLSEIGDLRVHPLELTAEDILPFVPDGAEIDQTIDGRVASIMKITAECSTVHATATHLLQEKEWDFSAVYYDAIDHYCHGFMKFRPPQQNNVSDHDFKMYRNVVDMGYMFHDMMLQQLLDIAGDETTVMLISDHGFHSDHLRPEALPNEPAGPAKEHRDYGIFVATGPDIKAGHQIEGANLLDITPTILTCYGLPTGEDMDGRVLEDIFTNQPNTAAIESWEHVEGDSGEHPPGFNISAEESQAAIEQLVALGYIDAPDEDSSKAVANCTRELEYNLARAYMDADMHGEAAPILHRLYRDYPVELRFGIKLASALQSLGDYHGLRNLLENMSNRWREAALLARKHLKEVDELTNERQKLWDEFKKLDDANADEAEVSKLAKVDRRGKPVLFSDDEMLLIRKLRSIAKVNPQSIAYLSSTAAAGSGDFEGALAFLTKAQSANRGQPSFHFHRGNILTSLGRFEEAEESLLRGLAIDESHPDCLMALARCRVEMGRDQDALKDAQKAIALQYHFPLAHYYAGVSHRSMGEFDQAAACFKIAISQNPNFKEAFTGLAELHETHLKDDALASEYRTAERELKNNSPDPDEGTTPFEFDPVTTEQISEHLPSIHDHANQEGLEPALANTAPENVPNGDDSVSKPQVIIVSGLPRSGTSMMMQMLAAGGVPIFTDGQRVPDENNPKGYYEVDLAKGLAKKNSWVHDCDGKCVKVVAPLIGYLPSSVDYRVIYMKRPVQEIIRSQANMLERLGKESSDMTDEQIAKVMVDDAHRALGLLSMHQNKVLKIDYAESIADPQATAAAIASFLRMDLDESAMAAAVDPKLHREKSDSATG